MKIKLDLLQLLFLFCSHCQMHYQGTKCRTKSGEKSDEKSESFDVHYCLYCKKTSSKIISHLQTVHSDEPEVAKAFSFDKNSIERWQILNLLQTRGNLLHDANALQGSQQDLIEVSKFAAVSLYNDNVYCINCLGLFSKKSFATHLEKCRCKCPSNAATSCNEMFQIPSPRIAQKRSMLTLNYQIFLV